MREGDLVRRNPAGADAALDAQAACRQHEGFAVGLGLQRHRPHRADQAHRDMDDVAARRQHDVGRGAAFLADQFENAGLIGLVGEHPPHQAVVDDRQVLAVARGQRQHGLAGGRCARRRNHRRHRGDASGCVSGARQDRSRRRTGRRRQIHRRPGRRFRDRRRRHRRRPVAEHLRRGRGRKRECQHCGKRKRREQASAPSGSSDPFIPVMSCRCFSLKTRQIQACGEPFARCSGHGTRKTPKS